MASWLLVAIMAERDLHHEGPCSVRNSPARFKTKNDGVHALWDCVRWLLALLTNKIATRPHGNPYVYLPIVRPCIAGVRTDARAPDALRPVTGVSMYEAAPQPVGVGENT